MAVQYSRQRHPGTINGVPSGGGGGYELMQEVIHTTTGGAATEDVSITTLPNITEYDCLIMQVGRTTTAATTIDAINAYLQAVDNVRLENAATENLVSGCRLRILIVKPTGLCADIQRISDSGITYASGTGWHVGQDTFTIPSLSALGASQSKSQLNLQMVPGYLIGDYPAGVDCLGAMVRVTGDTTGTWDELSSGTGGTDTLSIRVSVWPIAA